MKLLQTALFDSPVGTLELWADGEALLGLEFRDSERARTELQARLRKAFGEFEAQPHPDPAGAVTRLRRYFAGELDALCDQPVRAGGTEFEERVWAALRNIPAGEVRSYQHVAQAVGAPGASRAVGAANGRNPVAIVVPCHRVVAADGSLHGYGGGLERKRWLLEHEKAWKPDGQLSLKLPGC